MENFGFTETQLHILISLLKKHIQSGIVIIFGSRAKGTNTGRSDTDIALKNTVFYKNSSLGILLDEIEDSDFPYLVDIIIYENLENRILQRHIDMIGKIFIEL